MPPIDSPVADLAVERDGPVDALDTKTFLDAPTTATGSIVVTAADFGPGDVNLTLEGTRDWAHWGLATSTSFDHKLTGGGAISDVTPLAGTTRVHVVAITVTASWTDGTPDPSATLTGTGTGIQPATGGLAFTVPASTTTRTLRVYVGGKGSRGRLDAALSDNSAPAYSDNRFLGNTAWHSVYVIAYRAATDAQQLTVTWSDDGDSLVGGFEMLLSATLQ
jgi:hypothetical protein